MLLLNQNIVDVAEHRHGYYYLMNFPMKAMSKLPNTVL